MCFNKNYWVIVYSVIYIFVQIIASFDLSYAIYSTARVMGNEQEQIIKLYNEVPLLQVAVRSKTEELNCKFPREAPEMKEFLMRFRTTFAMLLHLIVFIILNYIAST